MCSIAKLDCFLLNIWVPVSPSRLRVTDWQKLELKHAKKLDVWQENFLSIGGRAILINSSISNIATYHMSVFSMTRQH
jgi:hypothetical protein